MLEEMRKMIAEQLNCEESEITADTSFKDDLGADSLDLFELVMALEDEYNIEIPVSGVFSEFIYFERQERYNDKDQNKICTEPYRKNACR